MHSVCEGRREEKEGNKAEESWKEGEKGGEMKRKNAHPLNLSYLRLNLFTQPCDSSLTSENTMERLLNCIKVKGHDQVRFDSAKIRGSGDPEGRVSMN